MYVAFKLFYIISDKIYYIAWYILIGSMININVYQDGL